MMQKFNMIIILSFLAFSILFSCKKTEKIVPDTDTMDELNIGSDFLFRTSQDVNLSINLKTQNNAAISGALVEVYNYDPANESTKSELQLLFRGITNHDGVMNALISVPAYLNDIVVCPQYLGIQSSAVLPVASDISFTFGGSSKYSSGTKSVKSTNSSYLYLGEYDANGVPNYLAENNTVSSEFLTYVNSILRERQSVPANHPEYIASNAEANIVLLEEADISLTFVHEGAGFKNSIGYYSYPTGNPPQSVEDIDNMTIIFPNSSFAGSGGGLNCGNTVKLKYHDASQGFVDKFPANTTVAWFMIANGWQNGQVGSGYYTHFSDYQFNIETDANLKRHNVFLLDEQNQRLILGFEDIRRDISGCDQDFNDVVFYASVSPFSSVGGDIVTGDPCTDTDSDGICDSTENYPNDPLRAFNNYTKGTLAFEDLWYNKGDYDFEDLVTDYTINRITNADNNVVDIVSTYEVCAIGAGFHNGFGFELPVNANYVADVSGNDLQESYIQTNANGTEANQTNAVVIVFDDAYNILSNPTGGFVNVYNNQQFTPHDSITVSLTFTIPMTQTTVGFPPFNPFLIKNGNREYEIHLAGKTPTMLQNTTLFGSGDDDTNPAANKYYLTKNNLPWALNFPEHFDYPTEKSKIIDAYLHFKEWAESSGTLYSDWYKNLSGYRNNNLIYQNSGK